MIELPRRSDRPGLPSGNDFAVEPYHSSFSLDAIGQPSLGVVAGGPFGTGVAGGVSMIFGDQLSDRQIFAAIQANGTVKDIGGAVQYYNLKNRWNWGARRRAHAVSHGQVYLRTRRSATRRTSRGVLDQSGPAAHLHRPGDGCSRSIRSRRRAASSSSANVTHYGFDTELFQTVVRRATRSSISETTNIGVAVQAGVCSPSRRSRSSATIRSRRSRRRCRASGIDCSTRRRSASVTYQTALADYRRYFFMRPFTLAFRGMSLGRYGSGAEDVEHDLADLPRRRDAHARLRLRLVHERRVRRDGRVSRSQAARSAARCSIDCSAARSAVVNAEFRIPLFGTEGFGLLNFPFLPTEVSPFFDAGVSYTNSQGPDFRFTRTANDIPTNCAQPTTQPRRRSSSRTIRAPTAFRCSARACRSAST